MNRRQFIINTISLATGTVAVGGSVSALYSAMEKAKNTTQFSQKIHVKPFPKEGCCFFAIGDWGTGGSLQREVAKGMAQAANEVNPQFIVSVGDNIYPNGVNSVDDPQWKTKFEDIYGNIQQLKIPWFAALGNHDHRGNIDAQRNYSKKNHLWEISDFIEIDSQKFQTNNDAGIIFIDTTIMLRDRNSAKKEIDYLERKILNAASKDWRIVVGHHPLRSYGHYGDNNSLLSMIKPILDRGNVAIYLCGHEHDLQVVKNPTDKFVCIVSGGGGGKRKTGNGEHSLFAAADGGFAAICLTKNEIMTRMYNKTGEVMYAMEIR